MSSLLFAELAATCNALGHSDGNKYYIEPYCKETIKDIIRYLRRDDENHQVRRHLGEAKILQSDLLPILKDHWEKEDLFEVILRLLVNLTNPALLLYREELPAEKTSRNYYLQIISHLQSYKEAFCDRGIWTIFSKTLQSLLQTDSMERESEKGLIIERILILVRNVLQVPADPAAEKRTDNDASIHDQMLWALHTSQMNDLFLYMASSESEQQYYMHILEIVSLMLREQNPAELASAAVTRSTQEKERDEVELLAIRQEEIRRRQEKVKKFTGARHSRFGGTYVLKDMKAMGDNDLIYHKPLNALDSLDFDHDKTKVRRPKNRLPMKEADIERRSAFCVRLFLKDFCTEFLNGAYNNLMYHVKDGLVRAKAQANDESYYMWALKFFMEFNRHHKFEVNLVSETMSVQTFHFVQTQLENCYEHLRLDKKKVLVWSRRMHLALKAYQELLMTLMTMDKSPDAGVRESSKVIKSNVFYIVEYRELILTLMLTFDDIKFSKSYLRDLIETVHVFLKLLEQFCSSRSIMVQKKRTKRRKKSKKSNAASQQTAPARNPEELWDEVGPQLSVVLQGTSEIPDVVPFDAASDQDIDAQKADAMVRIQRLLREHEYEEAVGLLRAAREVWPENDSFGSANMSPEEEFMALHDIFLAELPNANPEQPPAEVEQHEEEEEEEDEEEQQEADISYAEQEFNFIGFVRRFMHRKVVHACCLLLRQFDKNLAHTNHSIIKLLHRIVWDCKSPAMLFQASLFRTFQRILDSKLEQHKEMQKFAIFIIRKFVEVAKTSGKVYMELLFWKTPQEAYDIEEGYGSYQANSKAIKLIWSEEEEDELRRLYEEFTNRMNAEGGDATGGDVIDWIMQNMINTDRSRRGVTKKLRELGYNMPKQSGRKSTGTRPPLQWSEEEEQQLRELYEEFKIALDPLGCIIDRLTVRRPKNRIVEKLLELGLVQDKKELRKKRAKKQKSNVSGPSGWDTGGSDIDSDRDSESDDNSGSDSDGGRPGQTQKKPQSSRKPSANKKKQYSSVDLANVLIQIVAAGMSQALSWLSSCLTEVADDRETDGDEESIPLLPLTEEAFSAMENTDFHRLLSVLGLVPPSEEQERYWRIPGSLSPEDLRKRVEVIEQALGGRLVVENNEAAESTETVQNNDLHDSQEQSTFSIVDEQPSTSFSVINGEDHDKENNSQIITNKKKKQIENKKGLKSDSDDYSSTPKTESKKPEKTKRQADKRRRVESDSDDYTNGDINKSSSRKKNEGKTGKKQTKKVIRMDSGSETEEWNQRRNIGDDNDDGVSEETSKSRVRNVLSDSETEEGSSVSQKDKSKTRNILSDSDSENESLASSKTRKRVLSDSVSDHELTQSKKKMKSQKRNDKNKRKLSDSESDNDLSQSRRKDKLSQLKKKKNQRVFDSDDEQSQSDNRKDGFSGHVDPMEASESDGEVKRQADLKKRLMALASSDDDE